MNQLSCEEALKIVDLACLHEGRVDVHCQPSTTEKDYVAYLEWRDKLQNRLLNWVVASPAPGLLVHLYTQVDVMTARALSAVDKKTSHLVFVTCHGFTQVASPGSRSWINKRNKEVMPGSLANNHPLLWPISTSVQLVRNVGLFRIRLRDVQCTGEGNKWPFPMCHSEASMTC